MLIKRLPVAFFSILILLSFSSNLLACACCADGNEYSIWTGKPDSINIGILGEMKFDKEADLLMSDADFETIKGLGELQKDWESERLAGTAGEFDLVSSFTARTWKFTFKTKGNKKTGVLTLPLPSQMVMFKADIHDGKTGGAGGPLLYKEFRYKGTVASGSGFFGGSILRPTTYFLVFQGRGNNCDNASDFTHWRLEIEGRKASYIFVGEMEH